MQANRGGFIDFFTYCRNRFKSNAGLQDNHCPNISHPVKISIQRTEKY